jgi:hypothetical protein
MSQIGLPPDDRTVRKKLGDYSQIRPALANLIWGLLQFTTVEPVKTTGGKELSY